jgi:hypothetical protein
MHNEKSKQKNNQTPNSGDFVDVDPLLEILSNIKPVYHVKNHPAQFYKSPSKNLFWYRNLKAASTTYHMLFEKLGWHMCTHANVDWQNDLVFGHIIDPLTRFRKGLTESFFYRQDYKTLRDKFDFTNQAELMQFVANLRNIDPHCMSLEHILGSFAQKIYWIPTDCDLDHKAHTLKLLDFFDQAIPENIRQWWIDLPHMNQSTDEELEFYQKLIEIPVDDSLKRFLDFDQCVYDVTQYYFDDRI